MKIRQRALLTTLATACMMILFSPVLYSTEIEVEIEDFSFIPHGSRIFVGDMVTWRNRDDVQHSSTSDNGVWNSGLLSRDQSFSFVFSAPGVYPYHCTPHPTMRDTIFVSAQTGIADRAATPKSFELFPNYPNPFNARTTFQFALPHASHVSIDIFDLVGRKVARLVDQDYNTGFHQLTWNAGDQQSGVYFIQIKASEFSVTRRIVLLK